MRFCLFKLISKNIDILASGSDLPLRTVGRAAALHTQHNTRPPSKGLVPCVQRCLAAVSSLLWHSCSNWALLIIIIIIISSSSSSSSSSSIVICWILSSIYTTTFQHVFIQTPFTFGETCQCLRHICHDCCIWLTSLCYFYLLFALNLEASNARGKVNEVWNGRQPEVTSAVRHFQPSLYHTITSCL